MATVEITKSNKWAIGAIVALVIIILILWGVGSSMSSSKDGEMQKITTAITTAVDKMATQNKTIDDIDGAVKKFPAQLMEAIGDHEKRLHKKIVVRSKSPAPKPIRKLPEVQKWKPQPVDKVAIVSRALQDCNSFGGALMLREGKIICDMKKADNTPPVEKVAQPTPLQEGAECDSGKGHKGILRVVDGTSRCVWETAQAPVQQVRREQAPLRETGYYREPLREVYYEEEPQEEASSSSSFGSWLPWIATAVVGGIIYNNNRRNTTALAPAVVGGPVNPAPGGGPVNPLP
ncbi:MAG: hypothetical protein WBC83_02765 [Minisyncoccia bacterium]